MATFVTGAYSTAPAGTFTFVYAVVASREGEDAIVLAST